MKRPPIRNDLSAEFVRSILSYDPETGLLRWRVHRGGTAKAGSVAGSKHSLGYIEIMVCGRSYKAHRLAWLIHHGVWPDDEIDHRDGNKANNPILNLREASRGQNNLNRRTKGWSSYEPRKSPKKFRAAIGTQGKDFRVIGWFMTAEEARAAYLAAHAETYGEYSITQRPAGDAA